MAVDTRNKRASCLGHAQPWRVVLPNPDAAAEDQADRQQLAYCYPGILAGAPVVVALPIVHDVIDFAFTQHDRRDFAYTQDDVIDFPFTQNDRVNFVER